MLIIIMFTVCADYLARILAILAPPAILIKTFRLLCHVQPLLDRAYGIA